MDAVTETKCPRCYGFSYNGPGRPCSACIEEENEAEWGRRAATKLDRISGVLRRALYDAPMLKPEFQANERLGALTFAAEYAIAQLQELKKEVA